jgi:hypothetical protein
MVRWASWSLSQLSPGAGDRKGRAARRFSPCYGVQLTLSMVAVHSVPLEALHTGMPM